MSILAKKLHILKSGGSEETANIYTTTAECPEPNLKVYVDGTTGYVKLGDVNHQYATKGRVHRNSDNADYAILNRYAVSDFPLEWGKFKGFACTLSPNQRRTTYQYGWSLHFENGTLPVPVGYDSTTVSVDTSLYEATTLSTLNGTFYDSSAGKWRNCVASDQSDWMLWLYADGYNAGNMTYATATTWGWPQESGSNPTVFTDDFGYSVVGGVLTIRKNGNVFKTFNVYV